MQRESDRAICNGQGHALDFHEEHVEGELALLPQTALQRTLPAGLPLRPQNFKGVLTCQPAIPDCSFQVPLPGPPPTLLLPGCCLLLVGGLRHIKQHLQPAPHCIGHLRPPQPSVVDELHLQFTCYINAILQNA